MRVVLVGLLLVAAGCARHKLAPVSGLVTLDDQPLADATVVFQPSQSGQDFPGPGSQGKTDAAGRFTLQLLTDRQTGAVVGSHKVSITAFSADGKDRFHRQPLLGPQFNAKTTLTFDVPPAGTDQANFALKSR